MYKRTSLSISARRHFVDDFFTAHQNLIKGDVIDIGGKRANKRGLFDIDALGAKVTYVNIDKETKPDIEAPAENIPIRDGSYDIAIMGELLEHVPDPKLVLKEGFRILRPGGKILATVPFMYPIHADPYDYGRYAESYWKRASDEIGFQSIEIEKQGTIFAIAALMVQHIFRAKNKSWRPIQNSLVAGFMWLDKRTSNKVLRAWTTGYGLILTK